MRRLAELRLPDLADRISRGSILIQPVGSTEQHGPHLPFNTDLVIPQRTAEALAERYGDELDLWILPPLAYSRSNEHAWAPGTVWLSTRTLLSVIEDIGASLATLPARRLVFLNGHGGNSALLNVACRDLRLAHGWMTFLVHPTVPPDQGGESEASELGMGVHGGFFETALMLHLAPDLVANELPDGNLPAWLAGNRAVRFGGQATFGWSADDFGPDGHIGDPGGATAEAGERIFERTLAVLADTLREIRDFDLPGR